MKRLEITAAAFAMLASASACREGAPVPDYGDLQDAFDRADTEPPPPLEEPDPFVDGERRLVISNIFNETGFSQFIAIDGTRTNYFIFTEGAALTYEQQSTDDRVEGTSAERLTLAGTSFWGGGFVLEPGVDLTPYDVVVVHLKSSDIAAVNITIGDSTTEVPVAASDFGYAADGEYHEIRIPLSEYSDAGVDLSTARLPFAVGAPGGELGQTILVDYLYWEAE